MGNLSSRRGKIQGIDEQGRNKVVKALVPLSQMFGYATDLRSITQGRAVHTMQFSSYEPAPQSVVDEIASRS